MDRSGRGEYRADPGQASGERSPDLDSLRMTGSASLVAARGASGSWTIPRSNAHNRTEGSFPETPSESNVEGKWWVRASPRGLARLGPGSVSSADGSAWTRRWMSRPPLDSNGDGRPEEDGRPCSGGVWERLRAGLGF